MIVDIQIVDQPIATPKSASETSSVGAVAEFTGIVRAEENGSIISALEYEAYRPMAEKVMRQIINDLAAKSPCEMVSVIHRVGVIPVGEAAIYIRARAKHRAEAFAMVTQFMDRLKQDVPIWKVRALPVNSPAAPPR
ncbi:MAG: molybdenum cofactor biosynthesis protein MoaE [Nibricoccus sp.]